MIHIFMKTSLSVMIILSAPLAVAQENPYPGRRGLAFPEGTPESTASCADLAATIQDLQVPSYERVDLWATGPVSIVDTDRVLWYIGICRKPGVRVLCVIYSDNGMQAGDRVTVRGAMRVQDSKHILLDPCLASID
ncbi:hypothetical protein ABID21_005038 [Pseudorhizobium tarimense]|uniref:Uncharacterized protein n=1 Tax=Pseudorhizobium tarimense TaxID=1079109 RepID=A0ABV2HED6_9HYPH